MIKFFRKVRYDLMEKNKTGKYLKYAIGEIILVIIGILIALQINNWNIENKNHTEARSFSTRLLKEVRTNIEITDSMIVEMTRNIESSQRILDMFHMDLSQLQSGSLDSLVNEIMGTSEINLKLATFTEGLNTGKLAIISSDSLRTFLYGLPSVIDKVKMSESLNSKDMSNGFYPYMREHFNYRKMDAVFSSYKEQTGASAFPNHSNLEILKSMQFENIIDNRFFLSKYNLKIYQDLKISLEFLEKLLEE